MKPRRSVTPVSVPDRARRANLPTMAYDVELADRIRAAMSGIEGVAEKAMFGGLAFLVHGHMALAAAGKGSMMARVDPAQSLELLQRKGVRPMEMKGRGMTGWLLVEQEAVDTEAELTEWVQRCVAFVATLPPKPAKTVRTRSPRPRV